MITADINSMLEKAAAICVTAHAGQLDKSGKPYFLHPMRVAMGCRSDREKVVAMLHDVIEDCHYTPDRLLAEGFDNEIVDAVVALSRKDGESYEDYVARAGSNPLARGVKLRDLTDNLDVLRLEAITPEMAMRFNRYLSARRYLLAL